VDQYVLGTLGLAGREVELEEEAILDPGELHPVLVEVLRVEVGGEKRLVPHDARCAWIINRW